MFPKGFIIIRKKLSGHIITIVSVFSQFSRCKPIHISFYRIRIIGICKRNLFTKTFYLIKIIGRCNYARNLQTFNRRYINSCLTTQPVIPGGFQTAVRNHSQCILTILDVSPHAVTPSRCINRRSCAIL